MPVKAPPNTRRRMMPPTPQQNFEFFDGRRSVASGSGGTTKYLEHLGKNGNCGKNASDCMKLEIEELELLMDQED